MSGNGTGRACLFAPRIGVALLAVAACGSAGCYQAEPIQREQLQRGYVLILPGVECYAVQHAAVVKGLREAGEDRAIEINEWGAKPFGTFPNLMSYKLNRLRAANLAGKLMAYRAANPNSPITLIGYSGGGAMALFTAEALPADFRLDRIVLTAAAVSPDYDLGPALSRCERGIVSFYSSNDWFMVGLATETFGTMDRKKTSAAGRVGFQNASGRLLDREGLTQIRWKPEWRKLGHQGRHAGWRAHRWAREVLAREVRPLAGGAARESEKVRE